MNIAMMSTHPARVCVLQYLDNTPHLHAHHWLFNVCARSIQQIAHFARFAERARGTEGAARCCHPICSSLYTPQTRVNLCVSIPYESCGYVHAPLMRRSAHGHCTVCASTLVCTCMLTFLIVITTTHITPCRPVGAIACGEVLERADADALITTAHVTCGQIGWCACIRVTRGVTHLKPHCTVAVDPCQHNRQW
jgi:hypothetical protein